MHYLGLFENSNVILVADLMTKLVSDETKNSLPYREIKITDGVNNIKRHNKKPGWTSELTSLWNDLCDAETRMLWSNGQQRKTSRNILMKKGNSLIGQFNAKKESIGLKDSQS